MIAWGEGEHFFKNLRRESDRLAKNTGANGLPDQVSEIFSETLYHLAWLVADAQPRPMGAGRTPGLGALNLLREFNREGRRHQEAAWATLVDRGPEASVALQSQIGMIERGEMSINDARKANLSDGPIQTRSLHQAARILQAHWFPAGTVNPDLLDHLKDADFNSHPADIGVALALESLIEATQPHQPASNTQGDFMSTIDSTSNERTTNNAVRHTYRVLTEAEKQQMQQIKDMGAAFIAKLHEIGGTDPAGDRFTSRDLSLANTHAEDAVMRAVRHITA